MLEKSAEALGRVGFQRIANRGLKLYQLSILGNFSNMLSVGQPSPSIPLPAVRGFRQTDSSWVL